MDIIRLNNFKGRSWQLESITDSLSKLNFSYKIGLIDRLNDDINDDLEQSNINESDVDIILALRCDHIYDYFIPTSEREKLNRTNFNKPIIFIKSINTDYDKFESIKYPIWLTLVVNELKKEGFNTTLSSKICTPKKYLYSCLNNRVSESRIANYIEFLKSDYINKSLFTMNNIILDIDQILKYLGHRWNNYDQIFLNQIVPMLPVISHDVPQSLDINMFDYNNSAYMDSYVNVVTENSYCEEPFISEKIIKPLLAEQFFCVVGGRNTIWYLRELGFDTYDDIIDHSIYDNSDEINRVLDVHKLLNNIKNYNWCQIYKDTEQRRSLNKQKVLDLSVEKIFIKELTEKIYDILQF